ncbi:MAG: hypothetical protein ACRYG7_17930 [Janthinobacterium lividum]
MLLGFSHAFAQQPAPPAAAAPRPPSDAQPLPAYATAVSRLRAMSQLADRTGLTALVVGDGRPHTWQELDAYYRGIEQLDSDAVTKAVLKQRALFGLVRRYPFLAEAPVATRTYYAEELLAQRTPQPDLVVAFWENLRGEWGPAKAAQVKARALDAIEAALQRQADQAARARVAQQFSPPIPLEEQQRVFSLRESANRQKAALLALRQQLTTP